MTYFCLFSRTDCNNYECCHKTYDYCYKIYNLSYKVKNGRETPYKILSYDNSCNVHWIIKRFGWRDINSQSNVLLGSIITYEWQADQCPTCSFQFHIKVTATRSYTHSTHFATQVQSLFTRQQNWILTSSVESMRSPLPFPWSIQMIDR